MFEGMLNFKLQQALNKKMYFSQAIIKTLFCQVVTFPVATSE